MECHVTGCQTRLGHVAPLRLRWYSFGREIGRRVVHLHARCVRIREPAYPSTTSRVFLVVQNSSYSPVRPDGARLQTSLLPIVRRILWLLASIQSNVNSSYTVHSSLCIIFPLHFLGLISFTKTPASDLWNDLLFTLRNQLSSPNRYGFCKSLRSRYLCLTLALTIGVTLPALLWFAAVSLASYVILFTPTVHLE